MADAILILGAANWKTGPSPTLWRRTRHGANLWLAGAAPLIIPCGGLGEHPPTEAAAMAQILRDAGVPDAAIAPEDRSTTTLQNIRFALPILARRRANAVIIVTDRYHARRAAMVAGHFRLDVRVSCPPPASPNLKAHLREWAALPVYAARLRRLPRTE